MKRWIVLVCAFALSGYAVAQIGLSTATRTGIQSLLDQTPPAGLVMTAHEADWGLWNSRGRTEFSHPLFFTSVRIDWRMAHGPVTPSGMTAGQISGTIEIAWDDITMALPFTGRLDLAGQAVAAGQAADGTEFDLTASLAGEVLAELTARLPQAALRPLMKARAQAFGLPNGDALLDDQVKLLLSKGVLIPQGQNYRAQIRLDRSSIVLNGRKIVER